MKDVQVVKRHLKSCSIQKSKSDLHYYVTRMDATKSQIWTCGDMEIQKPSSLLVGCKCFSHLENTFTLLKNVKHSVAIWSVIPVLLQSIKAKTMCPCKNLYKTITAALFIIKWLYSGCFYWEALAPKWTQKETKNRWKPDIALHFVFVTFLTLSEDSEISHCP